MDHSGIDDYLILKYIQKQCSAAEQEEVLSWLGAAEENRKTYFRIKALWFALKADSYAKSGNLEKSMQSYHSRLSQSKHRVRTFISILKYAGILILVLGVPLYLWVAHIHKKEIISNTFITNDSIQSVKLGDSDRVWVKPDSKFFYSVDSNKYKVMLDGETYFKFNKSNSLLINMSSVSIECKRAEFYFNSNLKKKRYEFVLVRGSMIIINGGQQILLKPGDQAFSDELTKKFIVKQIDSQNFDAWLKNEFK